MFRKRDPEGRFIFNNVLMNGHLHMLEYLLENHVEAHANLPLTLEGNTTVLHQALTRAAFCSGQTEESQENSNSDNEQFGKEAALDEEEKVTGDKKIGK